MRTLSSHKSEAICIGDNIRILVTEIYSDRVKLGIEAPRNVPVYREEVKRRIESENSEVGE